MLETLRRIVQEVATAENLEEALDLIVHRVKSVMNADVCSVYLSDPASQTRVLMATDGLNPNAVGNVRLGPGQGLISLVCERAEPLNLENAPDHPGYLYLPVTGEEPYHGFLGVPIVHHRICLGVLVVQQRERRSFEEDEVTLLVTLAAQLSGAIAHAEANGGISRLKAWTLGGDKPFRGIPGSPGVAQGTALVIYPPADLDAVPTRTTTDIEGEIRAFNTALEATREEIKRLKERVATLPIENQALFDAYLLMLQSESLIGKTVERINQGFWASTALRDTVREQTLFFAGIEDDYLRERAQDIRELGRRILMNIQSKTRGPRIYPDRTVVVGEDISAVVLAEIPHECIVAVVSGEGSSSSHVAILARAMGIPTVMGLGDLPIARLDGCNLVVDGYQGYVYVDPTATVTAEYARIMSEDARLSAELTELQSLPAITLDGVRTPLYLNAGLLSDVASSADGGAEGVGLYRTEFPFMIRDRFPGEDEQTGIYRKVLEAFPGRPVVLRTLDIGGDKTLPYFPIKEDNPFLGWRGIRVSLDHPDIFLTQIRAMLRASRGLGNLSILLPMISGVSEVHESLELICRARDELLEEGLRDIKMPRIGAMVEVPSAVYQAHVIAKRVDFLSIGTNDLVQYILAVDRNNSRVASIYDCLHPAVIQAVQQVARAGARHQIPVSVCGEMASDPAAVVLLVGMGLDSLSMSASSIPRIKWVVRNFTFKRARDLLDIALQMEDSKSIRGMLYEELERAGLGNLVRNVR